MGTIFRGIMKINLHKILLTVACFTLLACSQTQPHTSSSINKINFNQDWRFVRSDQLVNTKDNKPFQTNFADHNWQQVSLPHTTNLEPLVVNNQWQGISWYRKTFDVPASAKGKRVVFELEAAMNHAKVWVNGEYVGEHLGGYLPVVLDLTDYVNQGENLIAIQLDNTDSQITGPKPLNRLDFNMYGGLYRNAWISYKNPVHITHANLANKTAGGGIFITTPKVATAESKVQIKTHVANTSDQTLTLDVEQHIYFADAKVATWTSQTLLAAHSDVEIVQADVIKNAKLWSPKTPNLYQAKTVIKHQGQILDQQTTTFGIREFKIVDRELYINGEQTYLRGVNRHQEYPFIGYSLSDNAQYRDAYKIKQAGFDFVRLSHYPHSPAFMRACDELGLVVLDAILGWQYYNEDPAFRAYTFNSARQLIRRDRNHPSVMAWEVSLNETHMPIPYMRTLHDIVKQEYPIEHNYSAGWKDDVYDIYLQARQHRILHPEGLLSTKPYLVSEYGDWEYHSNNAGLNQDRMPKDLRKQTSSRQLRAYGEKRLLQQAYNVQEAYNDNLKTQAFADGYWVMYDYNRGYHPDIEASGLMDIFRIPKFAYHFYQSQRDFAQQKVLKIASYWNENSALDVKVYANVDEVALYLNNKLIAKQSPDQNSNSDKIPNAPFTFNLKKFVPGTLKAVGYKAGVAVIEDSVSTPESAQKLKIWYDQSGKNASAGQNDSVFVYIAAVDNKGTVVPDYSGQVEVKISGDAQVMNTQAVEFEAGIATALIRIGEKAQPAKITARSKSLPTQTYTMQVE